MQIKNIDFFSKESKFFCRFHFLKLLYNKQLIVKNTLYSCPSVVKCVYLESTFPIRFRMSKAPYSISALPAHVPRYFRAFMFFLLKTKF